MSAQRGKTKMTSNSSPDRTPFEAPVETTELWYLWDGAYNAGKEAVYERLAVFA
jgi:hypothetical protein